MGSLHGSNLLREVPDPPPVAPVGVFEGPQFVSRVFFDGPRWSLERMVGRGRWSAQFDRGYGMDFPDGGYAAFQARRGGMLAGGVTHVEEQRALDDDRDRRLIEVVGKLWKLVSKESLERIARPFQDWERGAVLRREPGYLHGHVHLREPAGIATDDEMEVVILFAAGRVKEARQTHIAPLLRDAGRSRRGWGRRLKMDHRAVRRHGR